MINDKIIVGTMLVSQQVDILEISVNNLLKWCDWILLMMDNQNKEVEEKVYELQRKYYNKIWVRQSSIPHKLFSRSGNELTYHKRWKSIKGVVRNDVFINLRNILDTRMKGYEKIDILLFADSDVIFTNYLPELLNKFWLSDKKAISMQHIDVVNDFYTIRKSNIGHHCHIFKYNEELAGLPRRFYAMYYPLRGEDLMSVENYSVHLAYFNDKIRKWRNDNWKNINLEGEKLYKLPRSVEKMSSDEIKEILKH